MAENKDQFQARADPELLRQLDEAEAGGGPIEAMFILRRPGRVVLAPDQIERMTAELLSRVERQADSKVKESNVFKHLGSFVVTAEPSIVRLLLDQPEIESGLANRRPEPVDLLGGQRSARGTDTGRTRSANVTHGRS